MTLTKPLWLQAAPGDTVDPYTGQELRTLFDGLVLAPGVKTAADLTVTQRAGGANFTVDIAAGHALIPGTSTSDQGSYLVQSTATENRNVSGAPGAGFTRFDLVYAQVRDGQVDGGPYDWVIDVLPGTTSGVLRPTPVNAIPLAQIGPVVSGTGSITNALITDLRPRLHTAGQDLLVDATQTGSASATGTTRVSVIGTRTFRLAAPTKVKFTVDGQSLTGTNGGEHGRLILNVDGTEVRYAQWTNSDAGGLGLTSSSCVYTATLGAGPHTVKVDMLRVAPDGTEANASDVILLAEIKRS